MRATAAKTDDAQSDAPANAGRVAVALGPVELWIVGVIATAAIAGAAAWANSMSEQFREVARSVAIIGERVARIEGKLENK